MAKISVLIISDQTIQNVQFIKEFEADSYLFISTSDMEKKGCSKWIQNTLHLQDDLVSKIEVKEFEPQKIQEKLHDIYSENNQYQVNITGGTKLMSIAVNDFFKNKTNATIYYLTGKNTILNLKNNTETKLKKKITLQEYLTSYGIEIKSQNPSKYPFASTNKIYEEFVAAYKDNIDCLKELRDYFQEKNKKAKEVSIETIPCLKNLLQRFNFQAKNPEKIYKDEADYLTGKWLEEYTYHRIKQTLKLDEAYIGMGLLLKKNNIEKTDNDFDVMFVYENELYIVECKTSHRIEGKSHLNEQIYKLDALGKEFGIFSKTFLFTLGDLPKSKDNEMKQIRDRLKFHRMTLLTKENYELENTKAFEDWLSKDLKK
ncbi:MAG: DUF1887 family CARF protein [Raineya sp.]